jgi:hypothetical protein
VQVLLLLRADQMQRHPDAQCSAVAMMMMMMIPGHCPATKCHES